MSQRFLRNKKDRAFVFLRQKGRCAICGKWLKWGWHADHVIPWIFSQKTSIGDCQAVCPECNLRKGSSVVINEQYYESLDIVKVANLDNARTGQKGAINCIVDRAVDYHKLKVLKESPGTLLTKYGEEDLAVLLKRLQTSANVIPTRYGKSDVMRIAALELIERDVIAGGILVAPAQFLRDQLRNKEKIKEMARRYNITTNIRVEAVDYFRLPLQNNGSKFICMTTQMLATNINMICQHMQQRAAENKLPFMFFIDEVQGCVEGNSWGDSVEELLKVGSLASLLTATHLRGDNKPVKRFRVVQGVMQEGRKYIPKVDGDKATMEVWKTLVGEASLVPDYEYTFERAWGEDPEVICKINRIAIDFGVSHSDGGLTRKNKEYDVQVLDSKPDDDYIQSQYSKWNDGRTIDSLVELRKFNTCDRAGYITDDLANAMLHDPPLVRSGPPGGKGCVVYHMNGPHPKRKDSWDRFSKAAPEQVGKYILMVPKAPDGVDMVTDFNLNRTRKSLGKLVRHPLVIREVVSKLCECIVQRRATAAKTTGICFCSNDFDDKGDDWHANMIRDAILNIHKDWKVVIATTNKEDASRLIENFRDGDGDVLIVKQMASMGLDVDHMKVLADLSPVRTLVAIIQRIMRIGTVWGSVTTGDYITVDDIISKSLFESFVSGQGGNMLSEEIVEKVDEYDLDLEEDGDSDNSDPVWSVECVGGVNILDNEKQVGRYGEIEAAFLKKYPQFVNKHARPFISRFLDEMVEAGLDVDLLDIVPSEAEESGDIQIEDNTEVCDDLRKRIERARKRYASLKVSYKENAPQWIAHKKWVLNEAKRACGIDTRDDVNYIFDANVLESILKSIEGHLPE